jgi:gp16 family phage-associated protein
MLNEGYPVKSRTVSPQESTPAPLSADQAKAELVRLGISASEWARQHHVPRHSVYRVLGGRSRSLRGVGHKIAVLLGMKHGEVAQ